MRDPDDKSPLKPKKKKAVGPCSPLFGVAVDVVGVGSACILCVALLNLLSYFQLRPRFPWSKSN
jgi:hypothetical protein